jgi:flagellin-like protein
MKGITPVIAVILLLLITVSMAGFAFVFLQRSLETTTTSTEQSLQEQMNQQRQKVIIDNFVAGTVYIRQTGTVTIDDIGKIAVYVNGVRVTCGGGEWTSPFTPGSIKACNSASIVCNGNTTIKAVSPGGQDSATC